ncbi:hypothetical protein PHLCEN_2v8732, partial [Hermanssonia centrifuga]
VFEDQSQPVILGGQLPSLAVHAIANWPYCHSSFKLCLQVLYLSNWNPMTLTGVYVATGSYAVWLLGLTKVREESLMGKVTNIVRYLWYSGKS